jgi:hypothetical protein
MRLAKAHLLTDDDREEIRKFHLWLGIEASRKAGGDPGVCNMLEAALYRDHPEGIERDPVTGPVLA